MGKSDVVLYDFLDNRERFADLYNGGWFQGKEIILPGELSELDGRYGMAENASDGQKPENPAGTRSRDVKKLYRDQAVLRILAVENQTEVDYTMPCRGDKERLRQVLRENPAYRKLDEDTFRTLAVLLGEKKIVIPKKNEKEEGLDMCKALEDIWQEGIDIGIEKGIGQIVRNMLKRGMADEEIMALAECSREVLERVRQNI